MFISSLNFRKVFTVLTKACSVVQYICKVNINVFTCQIFIYTTRYCIFIICGKMKMLKIVNNLYIRMRLKCKFFWIKNNLFNKIFTKNIKVSRVTLRRKFSSVASTSSSRQDITIYHYTDYN